MIKLEYLLNKEKVFLHEFKNAKNVIEEFFYYSFQEEKEKIEKELNILFASYNTGNYYVDAFVLFEKEGKLYEVNASHCSCYGLEEQWEPEEVLLEELEHRLINGTFGLNNWSDNNFREELKEFLFKK